MRRYVAELNKDRASLWIIDGEWVLFRNFDDVKGTPVSDSMAGLLMRTAIRDRHAERMRMAQEDDLWRQHMELVHPDGEPCPDGCGGD